MLLTRGSRLCAEVTSPEQIFDIMAAGFEHRAVGCHDINAHSSRSHCLLIVHVTGTNISNGVRTVGKLTLCDLAGSERINKTGATGEQLYILSVACSIACYVRLARQGPPHEAGYLHCGELHMHPVVADPNSVLVETPQELHWVYAAGLTLTEAQNINRSLLELGNVISALMQMAPHVPYRCVLLI